MAKPEQKFWNNRLKSILDRIAGMMYDRVENKLNRSFPDVAYTYGDTHGYMELKSRPSNDRGMISLTHFTKGQRNWLIKRGKEAGFCFMVLESDGYIYFFDWVDINRLGKSISHQDAQDIAYLVIEPGDPPAEISTAVRAILGKC